MGTGFEIGFPASSQRTYVAACKPNIDGSEPGIKSRSGKNSNEKLRDIRLTEHREYPDTEILQNTKLLDVPFLEFIFR